MRTKASLLLSAVLLPGALSAAEAPLDASRLESVLGVKLAASGQELKAAIPQKELRVVVDGFPIVPAMGLTSWVAFSPHGSKAMAMGDLVLLEDEVGPIEQTALMAGLSVTAIHNHFLRDSPKVMFMHVGGMGEPEELARAVRGVLDRIHELRQAKRLAEAGVRVQSTLDPKAIEAVLGRTGQMADGVYKIVVPRPDVPLKDMGAAVSGFMGFNTWMAFQGSKERAAVCGDFAMLEGEVGPVLRELASRGIEVAALHNHMVTENPRIFFLHFWGVGAPEDLAKALKAALDQTGR